MTLRPKQEISDEEQDGGEINNNNDKNNNSSNEEEEDILGQSDENELEKLKDQDDYEQEMSQLIKIENKVLFRRSESINKTGNL